MNRTDTITAAILTETEPTDIGGGWGTYTVATFANGTTGLISSNGRLVALKVGRKLHVDGTCHWTKYGKLKKGPGLYWTGRKGWTGRVQCSIALWNMAGVSYAAQRAAA